MFGLSRNTLFAIGGVLLVVVLYFGFRGGDETEADGAKVETKAKKKKGKKQHGKKHAAAPGGLGVGKICAKLDCSDAQLQAFKSAFKGFRKDTTPQRRAMREANARIAAEYSEDALDAEAIDGAFDSLADQRAQIDEQARLVLEQLHSQLTPTQRETMAKLVALHGPAGLLDRPAEATKSGRSRKGKGRKGRGKSRKGKGLRLSAPSRAGVDPAVGSRTNAPAAVDPGLDPAPAEHPQLDPEPAPAVDPAPQTGGPEEPAQ